MNTASLTSSLPPLYANWIAEVLTGPIPAETKADCSNCAMCAKGEPRAKSSAIFFNPKIKCCTYLPEMFNFLVGRVLLDEDPALASGRAALEARLEKGIAVTPLGIGQTPTFKQLYKNNTKAFGQSETLRCPYYQEESGNCGVWRHRNSVCSTWFCKHERGETGLEFWKSLEQLLSAIEQSLARWCVLQLKVGAEAMRLLFPSPRDQMNQESGQNSIKVDDIFDPENYRKIWGNWYNREKEFYKECARLVNGLGWQQVLEICGPELQIYVQLLQEAYHALMSKEVPVSARVGSFKVLTLNEKRVLVQSYSPYDPVELPKVLLDLLPYFDGTPTPEVIEKIAAQHQIRLEPELVRKLVDYAILQRVD